MQYKIISKISQYSDKEINPAEHKKMALLIFKKHKLKFPQILMISLPMRMAD
jgi:hypothetical protein